MIKNEATADGQSDATSKRTTFGRRRMAPCACVADGKPHIRKFLAEALEELGFITGECADVAQLRAIMEQQTVPDLVIIGLSTGGAGAAAHLQALASMAFAGKVLLLGPRDSVLVAALQGFGKEIGLSLLAPLATPFDAAGLCRAVASLLRVEVRPQPAIDAAEALSAGWLELWYQPKFDVRTLQPCGAEALIRVRHPSWGVILPACFMPERDDPHLTMLSNFVIERAIQDWRNFIAMYRGVEIAINLPFAFFQDPAAVENLRRRLPDHPAFDSLIVEIDAADLLRDPDLAKAVARQLRFHNVSISIDDLGPEWPSLLEFGDFPFVEIKVDRQFIAGCADDLQRRKECRSILELADGFGARTVAEGVETRADFFAVRDMDFDVVQGFLLAKPMTVQKFAPTLRQSTAASV